MRKTIAERFWARVQTGGPDECWEWQGRCDPYGYIGIGGAGNKIGAHRWVMGCAIGDGQVVMHTCDNPRCVNPAHLRIGTHADNVADRVAKGRSVRASGARNSSARLTETQVIEIRRRYEAGTSQRDIASQFAIGQMTVSDIVRRKTWSHV